mmetsp:Transcript_6120/g.17126  ORF Transcript_6120/g.17126 Transcript_6120/m.17126 type:complete len:164 (-) Transcript_6120:115-606(-)
MRAWQLSRQLKLRCSSGYGRIITCLEVAVVIWILVVSVTVQDQTCTDLVRYLVMTVLYYSLGFLMFVYVLVRAVDCWFELLFCMLLVCGYVLVGYGLFVVVYAIYFDTCKPVLQWTAAVVTVFRMVHANVVECFVVRDFFNIDRDASVRALEASFAESVDVFP